MAGANKEPTGFRPHVVIAIIDEGIQPYHHEWWQLTEDPMAHPSSFLPGYPADSIPLALAQGETDPEKAALRDEALWNATAPATLYFLPCTKIVGLISFGIQPSEAIGSQGLHGTMTSSRAAANSISLGGSEVLLTEVVWNIGSPVAGPDSSYAINGARVVRWAADQPWIDIQSNSWGFPVFCAGTATNPLTGIRDAIEYAAQKQLVFSAVHNGLTSNGGEVGYPSECQDTAGPADVFAVGGNDNQDLTLWSNWNPYISADDCLSPAVNATNTTGWQDWAGGTSGATPFAAGGAARILLEARRTFLDPSTGMAAGGILATARPGAVLPSSGPLADGEFTRDELRLILFRTAVSPPTSDWEDGIRCQDATNVDPSGLPPQALYPFIGYGEINNASIAKALDVLFGRAEMPSRPVEDALYTADYNLRRLLDST